MDLDSHLWLSGASFHATSPQSFSTRLPISSSKCLRRWLSLWIWVLVLTLFNLAPFDTSLGSYSRVIDFWFLVVTNMEAILGVIDRLCVKHLVMFTSWCRKVRLIFCGSVLLLTLQVIVDILILLRWWNQLAFAWFVAKYKCVQLGSLELFSVWVTWNLHFYFHQPVHRQWRVISFEEFIGR